VLLGVAEAIEEARVLFRRTNVVRRVRAAAEREHANLLEMATRAAERIRSDARLVAESEVTAARNGLRSEVVEEAVRQATAILRGTIKTEDQERMVRDFVIGRSCDKATIRRFHSVWLEHRTEKWKPLFGSIRCSTPVAGASVGTENRVHFSLARPFGSVRSAS